VGSDGVELDLVGVGLGGQVEGVVDGLAVQPLAFQRLEGAFADPVLSR
jgi:hypothetical protein